MISSDNAVALILLLPVLTTILAIGVYAMQGFLRAIKAIFT